MRKQQLKKINYEKVTNRRIIIIGIVILILFSIVITKLVDVMIVNKEKYTEKLNELTYTRVLGTSSPRGRIYDRNYNIIVDNTIN